ncbi:GYF domain-containing protein [Flavobacterium lacisediminis]|uniref:GYF domain-containing protein n=1 Tax=Flavobacterium lacisediminis TaxID=2989705 RepID=A0ABT3EKQ7_9FLAO|nr:GYF domain-containing protein [Flavobacterium lacisediminis]MCW1149166.1 GYF domain-containing protein [Flavobacterium lacisediminis]
MKTFFLFIDDEQQGPFNLEELKTKKITRTTKVWYEGLEDWKNAEEIEELKSLFVSVPPPIKTFKTPPPIKKPLQEIEVEEEDKILGVRKKTFFISVGIFVLLLSLTFKMMQSFKKDKIEKGNKETEIYNEQLKIQNEEIAKQKEIIAEKERLEQERIEREREKARQKRINEIDNELNIAREELRKANKKLVNVTEFKFLRTANERESQIALAQEDISICQNNIEELEKEMRRLNPKWGN